MPSSNLPKTWPPSQSEYELTGWEREQHEHHVAHDCPNPARCFARLSLDQERTIKQVLLELRHLWNARQAD